MAILMTEEYWVNSQLSIARYYGRVRFSGQDFIIVNKEGKDIFECSHEAEKEGRDKAIPAGEPADLVDVRFQKYYRKLGRDRFIEILKANQTIGEVKAAPERTTSVRELRLTYLLYCSPICRPPFLSVMPTSGEEAWTEAN